MVVRAGCDGEVNDDEFETGGSPPNLKVEKRNRQQFLFQLLVRRQGSEKKGKEGSPVSIPPVPTCYLLLCVVRQVSMDDSVVPM